MHMVLTFVPSCSLLSIIFLNVEQLSHHRDYFCYFLIFKTANRQKNCMKPQTAKTIFLLKPQTAQNYMCKTAFRTYISKAANRTRNRILSGSKPQTALETAFQRCRNRNPQNTAPPHRLFCYKHCNISAQAQMLLSINQFL